MPIQSVAVLGVGLLGGSIGLAVRQAMPGCRVVGYVNRPAAVAGAGDVVDVATASLPEAVSAADLVILCTPIGQFKTLLEQLGPLLKSGAIVTDVGSTKRSVATWAKRALPPTVDFVGSHPMAGGERHGVRHSRADLLEGAICVVTPEETTKPATVQAVREFWRLLGMRPIEMSPHMHDALVARSSHLPHAVAAALVHQQDAGSLSVAGRGLLDTTRIAAGDAGVWRDILLDNRDNVIAAVQSLQNELSEFTAILTAADSDRLTDWLRRASASRQSFDDRDKKQYGHE